MMTSFNKTVRQAKEKNNRAKKASSMKIYEVISDITQLTATIIAHKKHEALRLLRIYYNWTPEEYTIRKIGKATKTTTPRVVSCERIR